MRKKINALMLALLLCGALTACGGGADKRPVEPDKAEQSVADDTTPVEAGEEGVQADIETQPADGAADELPTAPPDTGALAPEPAPAPAPAPTPTPVPEPAPSAPTASQASGYIGSSASALEAALGAPSAKAYSPSCMGEGEDGVWTYSGFTVYTYREGSTETVEAVQ